MRELWENVFYAAVGLWCRIVGHHWLTIDTTYIGGADPFHIDRVCTRCLRYEAEVSLGDSDG